MTSVFTKIINREIPSNIVWENEDFIAFLDIHPVKKGHLLLIPKLEVDKVYDLENDLYTKLFLIAKDLCIKMDKAFQENYLDLDIKRIGMAVEGFGVPHVHLHLIPLSKEHQINPSNIYTASKDELDEMREFYAKILN